MRDRPDFKKTQEIGIDLADQIAVMNSVSQVNLALNVIVPMDPENESHRGAPTIMRDGKIYIDTTALKQMFAEALDARDPSRVPDVLNLQKAVKNILAKNPVITAEKRPRETMPTIDADTVQKGLLNPTQQRNPNFAKTIPYTPPKKPNL